MINHFNNKTADVCLILEGSYPYVRGGVSYWTHDLILQHPNLSFHIVSILPRDARLESYYEMPANVVGCTNIHLQLLPKHKISNNTNSLLHKKIIHNLHKPLKALTTGTANLEDFRTILNAVSQIQDPQTLLDSPEAWALLCTLYEASYEESSMLDYFWSWRAVMGALFSLNNAKIPKARIYHAISTGYAGLFATRAHLETKRNMLITEHGIYTNERRIEIATADWLEETASNSLTIDYTRRDLRDFWITSFTNYSRIAYEAAAQIITLFEGNRQAQLADGAPAEKSIVISNSVDFDKFSRINPQAKSRPTIGMIARITNIKDVKCFIRGMAILRQAHPEAQAMIIGPTEETPDYAQECIELVAHLGQAEHIIFTGMMDIVKALEEIDVIVLTSISEAQPLIVLEAGAAGIPIIATDVGACAEMLRGKADEKPNLGDGGIIIPTANPVALANAAQYLLLNPQMRKQYGENMRKRVATYYTVAVQQEAYKEIYKKWMD